MPRIIDDGAGGKKNMAEIEARRTALLSAVDTKVYNPAIDQASLSRSALEATQGAMSKPAMRVYGRGGKIEADLKLRGGDNAIEEATDRGGEESQGQEGDARVQGGQAAQRFQARPQGAQPQAGNRDSASPIWVEQVYEAESKEAVMALVPAGSKGVEVRRVWKATALVKQ